MKRKLGQIETAMSVMHSAADGTTMGAKIILLTGEMTFGALKKGAECVFDKYAGLRCSIQREDEMLHFVEHAEFDRVALRQVHAANDQEWESLEFDEVHAALDSSTALWRVTLLTSQNAKQHKIIFVCHHAIIDAAGANQIIEDLLNFADKHIDGAPILFVPVGMPPAVDDFLLTNGSSPAAEGVSCESIPYSAYVAIEDRRTHFLFSKLSAENFALLKSKCEKSRISVNSIFTAALSMAACSTAMATSPVAFKTAVSLREYATSRGASEDALGCYLAVADTALDIHGNALQSIALEYQKKLMSYTLKNCFKKRDFSLDGIVNAVGNAKQSHSFNGFGITNLGKVDLTGSHKHFSLQGNYSLTNRLAGNYAFALQVSEFRDQVEFIYAYVQPLLDREAMERLSDAFNGHLADYYLTQ